MFDFHPWPAGESQEHALARVAVEHDLKHSRCTTVLSPSDYSLLLTEAPDVPAEELRAAIRWRVKDLIDFHVNDATLDVFELPGEKAAGRTRQMYAVAARTAAIQRRVDLMNAAVINLEIIDIPEMAQRNLAALLPEDVKGMALLSFAPAGGLLTITKQAEIYLSRGIDVGWDALSQAADTADRFDRIVLEVQRSLDYFDSHFRQAAIGHLVLAPLPGEIPGFADYLKANLNVTVQEMDLGRFVELPPEAPAALRGVCLNTLGAALRQEERAL
jgi:MSHA biogenesis protein MshI